MLRLNFFQRKENYGSFEEKQDINIEPAFIDPEFLIDKIKALIAFVNENENNLSAGIRIRKDWLLVEYNSDTNKREIKEWCYGWMMAISFAISVFSTVETVEFTNKAFTFNSNASSALALMIFLSSILFMLYLQNKAIHWLDNSVQKKEIKKLTGSLKGLQKYFEEYGTYGSAGEPWKIDDGLPAVHAVNIDFDIANLDQKIVTFLEKNDFTETEITALLHGDIKNLLEKIKSLVDVPLEAIESIIIEEPEQIEDYYRHEKKYV